ncbi:hypothetical protein QN277_011577 [Acacia crassicarpa]|uniref:Uncharacterized protein n=1 Tax=Acacia crassicarpa TaxID=499986 RepID=A0AAE1TBV8_9FABA|nr:hypothetical protein QN277_011577 [Acacia crassicarpa]
MEALTSTLIPSQRRPAVPPIAPARQRRQHCGRGVVVARASGSGRDHRWGRQVDENMIMLRLRIREIKMMEEEKKDDEEEEGSGMMRWEREYYVGEYGKHVCEVLGLLQSYLMTVRPCLSAGIVLLVALSVFMSSGLLLFNSINMMNTLCSSLIGLS